MDLCFHDTCSDPLREMGIIFNIYTEIVFVYLKNKSPILVTLCECSQHKNWFQMVYELERRFYLNILEHGECEIMIAPRGIHAKDVFDDNIFICNCGCLL